ncbi:hypothetical protein [Catenuloplanes japonicus]|uniref:hypothetical protein n=1 Tax=Catenuloplanes japonicus TaxID=33876 RepID=UPI00052783FF|nr:hypothetical protein [Catenuloplanes japonicus]
MSTPIGSINSVYTFSRAGSDLVGSAVGAGDESQLDAITVDTAQSASGARVTWKQTVRKPLRLNLEFDVEVDAGEMNGRSRAGRLPQTKVSGRRRIDPRKEEL